MQLQQKINAIDVALAGQIDSKGVALYEPARDGEFYTFLKDVTEHEKVIGFEWDGTTFGVILGN